MPTSTLSGEAAVLFRRYRHVVALELGSQRTRVGTVADGVLLDEPTLVAGLAPRPDRFKPRLAGYAAALVARNLPQGWRVVRPVARGAVTNVVALSFLIRTFLEVIGAKSWYRAPAVLLAAWADGADPMLRPVYEAVRATGARHIAAVATPIAALCGAGVPLGETRPWLVIHLGHARTLVAIGSPAGLYRSETLGLGTVEYARAVEDVVMQQSNLVVPDGEVELGRLLAQLAGRAERGGRLPEHIAVHGVDRQTGLPRTAQVRVGPLLETLRSYHRLVAAQTRSLLEDCPRTVTTGLMDTGVLLSGGGAWLPELSEAIRHYLGIPVFVPDRPDLVVAEGLVRCARVPESWGSTVAVRVPA